MGCAGQPKDKIKKGCNFSANSIQNLVLSADVIKRWLNYSNDVYIVFLREKRLIPYVGKQVVNHFRQQIIKCLLGEIEGRRRRGWQRAKWLDGITDAMDMSLNKRQDMVKDREFWCAAVHGVTKIWIQPSDWTIATISPFWGFPHGSASKEPACQCRRHRRPGFDTWVGKLSWRRILQPNPLCLPGKFYGPRSLVVYRP